MDIQKIEILLGAVFLGSLLIQIIIGKLLGWEHKFDKEKYGFGIRWVFFLISGLITGLVKLFAG